MPASRSHLVPAQVADRNGRMTTVYRKPSGDPIVSKRFPKPVSIVSKDADAEIALDALQSLRDCGVFQSAEPQDKAFGNLRALAKASPVVLEEVTRHIEHASKEEQALWYWKLRHENLDPDESYVGQDVNLEGGEYYRRQMAVSGIATRITKDIKGTPPSTAAGTSIIDAEYMMRGNYGESYNNLKAAVIVLGVKSLWFSENVGASPRKGSEIEDALYIANNIDAVERVIDELVARRTTHPEVVAQLIGTHSGLAEGNL